MISSMPGFVKRRLEAVLAWIAGARGAISRARNHGEIGQQAVGSPVQQPKESLR
jgi:hypothetical protein